MSRGVARRRFPLRACLGGFGPLHYACLALVVRARSAKARFHRDKFGGVWNQSGGTFFSAAKISCRTQSGVVAAVLDRAYRPI